jgi:hypothetical protein
MPRCLPIETSAASRGRGAAYKMGILPFAFHNDFCSPQRARVRV